MRLFDRLSGGRSRTLTPFGVLLPLACLASAIVLGASELMNTFVLVDATGEPVREISALDRHAGAMLVLAGFAIVALALAVATGSKAAAIAVAVSGGVALLIFLTTDLPAANQVGALEDEGQFLANAEARPQSGFWLQLVGALSLAVSGAALATLGPTAQPSLRGERGQAPPGTESHSESRGAAAPSGRDGGGRVARAHPGSESPEAAERVSERVARARRTAARRRSG